MLENKVAIITGGTRGIGLETVKVFMENKAKVILFGSKEETVKKAIDELKIEGFEAKGYAPNLNDLNELEKIMKEIYEEYGSIDILINNAGISAKKKIEETSQLDFESIMDLNVNAIFNTTKAVVPYMKEQKYGKIVNISSVVGVVGNAGQCNYSASKAGIIGFTKSLAKELASRNIQINAVAYPTSKFAVNGLTKSLARELAPSNIRVNAVAPGITKTDMVASLPKEMIEPLIQSIPLGRIGEPRDIANAFLFLASDMASYITGVILSVDGCARC